ncbi:MAG: peptidylprolyl isomerase [Candidatus Baltobacteraceae bacterium]
MSKASRFCAGLITSALALTFVLAGCSANSSSGGDIASVNGDKISRADFDAKLEGGPQAKQILNSLVQEKLIDQYAKDNNVTVSEADVQKKEDDIKSKYPPGQFDTLLKQQNLTEDDVKKILRQQLVIQAAVDKNITVTDKQIQDYLAKNHATLDKPDQVHARHILVADLKTADMIEQKLKAGGDFAALAKQYSTDPSSKDKGGDLGFFSKGQMVPAFQSAAFTQKLNVVGPPVKSPFGYHIIEVLGRKPATVATFANSKDTIRDQLKTQQEQTAMPTFMQSLRSKAKIDIFDDKLKDAIPPAPPAAPSTAASPAAKPSAASK